MVGAKHLVILAVALCARPSAASPVYQEEHYEGEQIHEHHQGLPPATSYATISTTHVKVQHPAEPPTKYATPYKYEYLTQPQIAYKYVSIPSSAAIVTLPAGKSEAQQPQPSAMGFKYLAASPTYKYVQPPAVTTEPEAAEEPTNPLKFAFKYQQNAFKQEQQLEQQQDEQVDFNEQPAVQYKYIAVPAYKYVQQQAAPEYGQLQAAATYDYGDDKQQF